MSAIGAPEGDLLGAFKNVKQIDGEGAIALVKAAEEAGVQHFVMVRRLKAPASSLCDAGRWQPTIPTMGCLMRRYPRLALASGVGRQVIVTKAVS